MTRVSRRAVLLAGVFGAALGLVVLMLGFGDHSAPRKDGPADENAIRPSGPIESVKDLPQDYTFDVNRLGTGYDGLSGPTGSRQHVQRDRPPKIRRLPRRCASSPNSGERCWNSSRRNNKRPWIRRCCLVGQNQLRHQRHLRDTGPATMPTIVMLGPDASHHVALA